MYAGNADMYVCVCYVCMRILANMYADMYTCVIQKTRNECKTRNNFTYYILNLALYFNFENQGFIFLMRLLDIRFRSLDRKRKFCNSLYIKTSKFYLRLPNYDDCY